MQAEEKADAVSLMLEYHPSWDLPKLQVICVFITGKLEETYCTLEFMSMT